MRICVETHGCRLNHSESDALEAALRDAGHEIVDPSLADVFVLNSCTITHSADADARKRVRNLHRARPDVPIVVTGCYANSAPEVAAGLPGVGLVVGNADKDRLVDLLEQRLNTQTPARQGDALVQVTSLTRKIRGRVQAIERPALQLPSVTRGRRSRAFLKIQDGCNYRCSFCIVPFVRGKNRSQPPAEIEAHFEELVAQGRGEVVLTGVHLGTYGWDMRNRSGMVELLAGLLRRRADARIRLGSLDPHEVRQPLIELMAADGGVGLCRHLHLPVQSGDDGVLRAMRRAHRANDIRELVPKLRERVTGICVGTDVIVGFPGETDSAFDQTVALFDDGLVDYAHVFTYSKRDGTDAAQLPEQVSAAVKSRRNEVLREKSERNWLRFRKQFEGQMLDAVVIDQKLQGTVRVLTDNYIEAALEGGRELIGRRFPVLISRVDAERVDAQIVT